jgi:arabinan endo-1,5-alpha-L-arabinosidase
MNVTVAADTSTDSTHIKDLVAYYDFNSTSPTNAYNTSNKATRKRSGSGKLPVTEEDNIRPDKFFHQYFGANGSESYTQIPNPFYNKEIGEGLTISFWVKCKEDNQWDAIWSFYNSSTKKRLYMTGNAYFGFNNNTGNWIDINHPTTVKTNYLPVGKWTLATITISREKGIELYINGTRKSYRNYSYDGSQNGNTIADYNDFDYNEIVDFITESQYFYLGYGSFWGSADACYDDLLIYSKVMTTTEIFNLKKMCNRIADFTIGEGGTGTGIESVADTCQPLRQGIYDLMGRKVSTPVKGRIYIIDGKKVIY